MKAVTVLLHKGINTKTSIKDFGALIVTSAKKYYVNGSAICSPV